MSCSHLSLTGEKIGIFSQIWLKIDIIDDSTGLFQSDMKNIFDVFLQKLAVLNSIEESDDPASPSAIIEYITGLLSLYRRNDIQIPIADIEGLIAFLSNYALNADLLAIDSRLTHDEQELHAMATAMSGLDFMQNETTMNTWLSTHVKDWVLDTALRQSKFHQIYETGNLWAISWMVPNHYMVSLTSTDRGYQPDQIWAGYGSREITNRDVHMRFRFTPSGLWTPLNPIPAAKLFTTDMNEIFLNDIEFRGLSSILLGKQGSPQEGKFRVKAITQYGSNTSTSFPDDPLSVEGTETLMEADQSSFNVYTPVNITGQLTLGNVADVEQRLKRRTIGSIETYQTFNYVHKKQTIHVHNNFATDNNFMYAPKFTRYDRTIPIWIEHHDYHSIQKTRFSGARYLTNPTYRSWGTHIHMHPFHIIIPDMRLLLRSYNGSEANRITMLII